jgi:hypothetical protein
MCPENLIVMGITPLSGQGSVPSMPKTHLPSVNETVGWISSLYKLLELRKKPFTKKVNLGYKS